MRERALGQENPDTLMSVTNLAILYTRQARYGEAEALLKRALDVRERVLGQEHADTLLSVTAPGSLYQLKGDMTPLRLFTSRY